MKETPEPGTRWPKEFFGVMGHRELQPPEHAARGHSPAPRAALWVQALFAGQAGARPASADHLVIMRGGVPLLRFALPELPPEAVIGRHPAAAIRLEAHRLAMFHACLWRFDDEYYIEALDPRSETALDRRRLQPKYPVRLHDGAVVDLPGHQLRFTLPAWPEPTERDAAPADRTGPAALETPTPANAPAPRPLRSPAAEPHREPAPEPGTTRVTVVDVIDETPDTRTFRCVGKPPRPFAYHPGQFVTLVLDIAGREVARSYSLSSSPSRPHTLDLTVKRVPGGLVSNWLCDHLRRGDTLRIEGPSGRFTCAGSAARRLLFIAAGSGVTPIMSMCRWLIDTAADVDVKLLASFRTPAGIIFRKELEWMSARHRAFRIGLTLTGDWHGTEGWTGLTGRIDTRMLTLIAPDYREREIFLCGPDPFMDGIKALLREVDFDFGSLRCESFGAGRVAPGPVPATAPLSLAGRRHKVTFTKTGLTVDTDERTPLLVLAEAHGIPVDYSCRSGCCGECEVRCRGEVATDPACEIDARARAAGFVWACSCTARSDLELDH